MAIAAGVLGRVLGFPSRRFAHFWGMDGRRRGLGGGQKGSFGGRKGSKGGSEASEEGLGRLEGLHPATGRGGGPDLGAAAMPGKDVEGGWTRPNEAPKKS